VTPFDRTSPTFLAIPDYPLQHVTSIYQYYLYTGDKAFLQAQWPVVQKVIALYASLTSNPQHLVIPPAFFGSPSADTLTNAHFYGVLLQGAQLAEAVGHADVATGYRAAAAQLRQAINTVLYNSTTGLYDVNTAQKGVAYQHGNSYAVLYGVAPGPGTTVASILQKLTGALYRPSTAPNATGPIPYWSTATQRWVLAGGERAISVGASSRDIRLHGSARVEKEDQEYPRKGAPFLGVK